MGYLNSLLQQIVCALIKVYRLCLSPVIGPCCRYEPSCSEYALTALQYHGAARGIYLTCRRLLRCHPWAPGGYDPVLLNTKKEKL